MGGDLKDKLRALRESLGWTQTALAARLKLTTPHIQHFERGRRRPPGETLIAIGKLAGAPECWYWWGLAGLTREDVLKALTPSSTEKGADENLRELTAFLNKLSSEEGHELRAHRKDKRKRPA